MVIDTESTGVWKSPFKKRVLAFVVLIGLISVAVFNIISSYVGSPSDLPDFTPPPGVDFSPMAPSAITIMWGPYLLVIAVVFISILAFSWIPHDIVSNLGRTLTNLGWIFVSGNLQRGSCTYRFEDWELSISIHVYTPSSHQWGSVTLLLLNTGPTTGKEYFKRFQENGYAIVDDPLPGKISCHTTIPNLPWQVFRISSLTSVKNHTTAFS